MSSSHVPVLCISNRSELLQFSNSGKFSAVRFRRSADGKGWALLGIPAECIKPFAAQLFLLNCKLIERVWFSKSGYYTAICFTAPPEVIAALAKAFPAPADTEPLVFSAKGDRVLTGATATRARGHLRQSVAAGPAQLVAI
ncbi:MAG: hypothetical protein KME16_28025 [Scytolyngbya sp. HA4215-MV1]|nr:hypothetical protein [Scytolyngbya sp. HA4215-MV1]